MDDSLEMSEWSATGVWLHPCAARDYIDECQLRIMDTDRKYSGSLQQMETLRMELESRDKALEAAQSALSERDSEVMMLRSELEATSAELASARETLATQKSVDEKLEEFNKELTKVEDMKRGYERKIAALRQLLARERSMSVHVSDSDENDELLEEDPVLDNTAPPVIDMTQTVQEEQKPAENTKKKSPGRVEKLRNSYMRKPATGMPETIPGNRNADEWLLDLPDNL